jgi:hypothetical protein
MSLEEKLPEELKAFEAALASLTPSADRLSRDRLMYMAGQAALASPKTHWHWPAAFSAMTALAATLAVLLISQPAIRTANHAANPYAASFAEGKNQAANQAAATGSPQELEPLLTDYATSPGIDGRGPSWALALALSGRVLPPMTGEDARREATDSQLQKPPPTPRQVFEELFPGNPRYRL